MLHGPSTIDSTMLAVPTIVGLLDAGVKCVEEGFEFEGLRDHLEGVDLRVEDRVTTRSRYYKGIGEE